jgi:tRNA 5-methylaminomethyl-2-thiouridine biosynthesis bifunctional protein
MNSPYRTHNACLGWTSDGQPFAEDHGDVYHSRADALGESTHVFLEGNTLGSRFHSLQQPTFIIGELGFGAGLNFLNTCRLWCEQAPATATLHYLACELQPLHKADLERVLARFPTLTPWANGLLALYPHHSSGTQQLELRYGAHRICLTLLLEDATTAFAGLAATAPFKVDAWFMDGFSPKTNPAMWHFALLKNMAALSQNGTTLASYSVSGAFRRGLAAAGFAYQKARGFSGKRHMLHARFAEAVEHRMQSADSHNGLVCVVGGGLAGCSTAYALACAGWQVLLIEQGPHLAMGASGNPQGILHFKPGTVDTADNRFNMQAYLYATRYYRSLGLPADIWSPCGMLQLAHDDKLQKRFAALAASGLYAPELLQVLDSTAASICSDQAIARPALYFPAAGWLSPARLCAWYCAHPQIKVLPGHGVTELRRDNDAWLLSLQSDDGTRLQSARHVVICNSADAWRFTQARRLPLICNRGQVDLYTEASVHHLDRVICGQGYLIPAGADGQAVGGSFFLGPDCQLTREQNRQQHLLQLAGINPGLAQHFAAQQPALQRIAERCTLPGRMPAVGALEWAESSSLWINVGHGSHGLARTPLCAALLASQLGATPAPLSPDLQPLLSPTRFAN